MLIDTFIGKEFEERALYDCLLFDIEANFDLYREMYLFLYFDRTADHKIKPYKITHFKDSREIHAEARSLVGKQEFIYIYQLGMHICFLLLRLDSTGIHCAIWKERTRRDECSFEWLPLKSDRKPLTEEQIRLGFLELAGFLEEETSSSNPKTVKAVF